MRVWDEMADPFGDFHKALMLAEDLRREKRYIEAIAYLDKARWDYPSHFDIASDLIIDIKQEGNIPLSVSEKKQAIRREAGEACKGMPGEARQAAETTQQATDGNEAE